MKMVNEKIKTLLSALAEYEYSLSNLQYLRLVCLENKNIRAKTKINLEIKLCNKWIKWTIKRINKLSRLVVKEGPIDPFDYWIDAGSEPDKQRLASDKKFLEVVTHVAEQLRDSPFADTHGWYESNWGIFVMSIDGKEHAARNRRLAYSGIGSPLVTIYNVEEYLEDINQAKARWRSDIATRQNLLIRSYYLATLPHYTTQPPFELQSIFEEELEGVRPGLANVRVAEVDQSTATVNSVSDIHLSQLFIHSPKGPNPEPPAPSLPSKLV
jgi:hypothetical protein